MFAECLEQVVGEEQKSELTTENPDKRTGEEMSAAGELQTEAKEKPGEPIEEQKRGEEETAQVQQPTEKESTAEVEEEEKSAFENASQEQTEEKAESTA